MTTKTEQLAQKIEIGCSNHVNNKAAAHMRDMEAALVKARKFIDMGFEFCDGDVYGVWHNDAVDALAEIIKLLEQK